MELESAAVKLHSDGGTLTASVSGEIDHHSAKKIREAIDAALVSGTPDRLTMDFAGVTFMDSSGLGLLLGRFTKASEAGIAFSVSAASGVARRMFDMAGISRIIKFEYKDGKENINQNEKG